MNIFLEHQIIDRVTPIAELVTQALRATDVTSYERADHLAGALWDRILAIDPITGTKAGAAMELVVSLSLVRHGVAPFARTVDSAQVPTHRIDFWMETVDGSPIVLSSNVKVKERWRNENLAAYALKIAFPSASWYLVTEDEADASRCRDRIAAGEVKFLDGAFSFRSKEFGVFVEQLQEINLRSPQSAGLYKHLVMD
jgi:hypothetical protein